MMKSKPDILHSIRLARLAPAVPLALFWAGAYSRLVKKGFLGVLPTISDEGPVYWLLAACLAGSLAACALLLGWQNRFAGSIGRSNRFSALSVAGIVGLVAGTSIEVLECCGFAFSLPLTALSTALVCGSTVMLAALLVGRTAAQPLADVISQALLAGAIGQALSEAVCLLEPYATSAVFTALQVVGVLALFATAPSPAAEPVVLPGEKPAALLRGGTVPLFSAVALCLYLSCFTTGNAWRGSIAMGTLYSIAPFSVASSVAALAAVLVLERKLPENKVSFLAFRAALPVVICIALAFKIIPVDLTTNVIYRDIMRIVFVLSVPLASSMVAYSSHGSSRKAVGLFAWLVVACIACEAIGLSTSWVDEGPRKAILGVATAIVLIYEAVLLGKGVIEYNKPVDIDPPEFDSVGDLTERCHRAAAAYGLTPRESEVLNELALGHSSGYIASAFCISSNTARSHMKNIYRKFGISSREELLEFLLKETA